MLGRIEGRGRGPQRMRQLDGITNSMHMNMGKLWEVVRDREAWHAAVHGVRHDWVTEQQQYKVIISSNYLEKLVVNLGIHTRLTMLILN